MKFLVLNTWAAKLSQVSFLKFKKDTILCFITSDAIEKKNIIRNPLTFSLINNQTKDVFELQENSLNGKVSGFICCNRKH